MAEPYTQLPQGSVGPSQPLHRIGTNHLLGRSALQGVRRTAGASGQQGQRSYLSALHCPPTPVLPVRTRTRGVRDRPRPWSHGRRWQPWRRRAPRAPRPTPASPPRWDQPPSLPPGGFCRERPCSTSRAPRPSSQHLFTFTWEGGQSPRISWALKAGLDGARFPGGPAPGSRTGSQGDGTHRQRFSPQGPHESKEKPVCSNSSSLLRASRGG